MRLRQRLVSMLALLTVCSATAEARSVTLAWDRNAEPEVSGYTVLYGTASRTYTHTLDVGNVISFTVAGLPDSEPVYFAVRAYTRDGLRSGPSDEVVLPAAGARVYLDTPGNGALVQQPFTLAGWAADAGSLNGTGIDAVHVYAYPNGGRGTPFFLGAASLGTRRPDVAAFLGNPRFEPTGFTHTVANLLPGPYLLVAFGHSVLTGGWNASARTITVRPGPALFIESPAEGSLAGQPFYVTGWALDLRAAVGTGMEAVMVYAEPASGGARIPLGEATRYMRPELVGQVGPQFAAGGFFLGVHDLPAGRYNIVVEARSTVTGAVSQSARRAIQTGPLTIVDAPDGRGPLGQGFSITGWSIDRRSRTGAGIDALHVYAYPLDGREPIFLGAADVGLERPDIAALYGPQFVNSGYRLGVHTTLAPGNYLLVLFPRSTVSQAFATPTQLVVTVGR